ncbi:MAG TPA: hypothetical protein EYN93_00815 [Planctomycetaceae bacterium]|nr:hypothetical protein [Planctomycetaceae bacterium]
MKVSELNSDELTALEQVLGYLNFSTGTQDPRFYNNLNLIWKKLTAVYPEETWTRLYDFLFEAIDHLAQQNDAFANNDQSRVVIETTFDQLLRTYFMFHQDLLFHQSEIQLFNSYFIGRAFDLVLSQGPDFEHLNTETLLRQFNDFVGYRPVATLESQKIQPYAHEWLRPVPLYIQGSGACEGPYQRVIAKTVKLLAETDEELLREACLDTNNLKEIAFDPRSYDFDHPVNKRPNHHFGMWDPHHIDQQGCYDRFVIQKVTLDALMQRQIDRPDLDADEALFEAAAVLAGTILMSSGINGWGPSCHDSSTTLASLMPQIANYRDRFYRDLLQRTDREHRDRLAAETLIRHQPFGDARQHLNAQLTETRAHQLEHIHLGQIFAFMGHHDAAREKASLVPVPSARFRCRIACQLDQSLQAIENKNLSEAADIAGSIFYLIQRGIQCGAFADPWNILGFDCQFSLFPALENSVHDHRIDELVLIVEQFFALLARTWSEAAANDDQVLCQRIDEHFQEAAQWWHKYAAHEVTAIHAADPNALYDAASHVAEALNLWHKGGAEAGNVKFWAPYAQIFDSPKAYSLVIHSLLEQGDHVASMALLIHWLSEADRIPLEQNDSSFYILTRRWLLDVIGNADVRTDTDEQATAVAKKWNLVRKLFDYFEANSEDYWIIPEFNSGNAERPQDEFDDELESDEPEEEQSIFSAAYENVSYRDSTDDGVEGEIFDNSDPDHSELLLLGEQIDRRLAFHDSLASLWKIAGLGQAISIRHHEKAEPQLIEDSLQTITNWSKRLAENRQKLEDLIESIGGHVIPAPVGDFESMTQYDRHRITLESLTERAIATTIEVTDTKRILDSVIIYLQQKLDLDTSDSPIVEFEEVTSRIFAELIQGNQNGLREHWDLLIDGFSQLPLLYVPLSKGGQPRDIVNSRIRQRTISDLLLWLPRLGLIHETCHLLETARAMERQHPVGLGAVTEFDELFNIGYQAIVECLIASCSSWDTSSVKTVEDVETASDDSTEDSSDETPVPAISDADAVATLLVQSLEQITESMLSNWLAHSQTLRLSVLERINNTSMWNATVAFIETYGNDLFTQQFLAMGNIRGILLQGVENWLTVICDEPQINLKLCDDLTSTITMDETTALLSLILESIVENYNEYRDYNSTTTQSDHGEMLYMLLDFLRLRTRYDRICWNLRPVIQAHQLLTSHEKTSAALLWRESLIQRIQEEANIFLGRLEKLQQQYSMKMRTVANRIGEQFTHSMHIDFLRSLVEPALEESQHPDQPRIAFDHLLAETNALTETSSGSGIDVPSWIVALEEEIELLRYPDYVRYDEKRIRDVIPQKLLSIEEVDRQLQLWLKQQ